MDDAPDVTVTDDANPAEAAIEALRAKHPDLVVVEVAEHPIAFRPMTRPEYSRFRAQVMDEKRRADAVETLARAVVVYPDRVAFGAFLDRYPAAAEAVGEAVIDAGGGGKAVRR